MTAAATEDQDPEQDDREDQRTQDSGPEQE
jgi:hypothetical protein